MFARRPAAYTPSRRAPPLIILPGRKFNFDYIASARRYGPRRSVLYGYRTPPTRRTPGIIAIIIILNAIARPPPHRHYNIIQRTIYNIRYTIIIYPGPYSGTPGARVPHRPRRPPGGIRAASGGPVAVFAPPRTGPSRTAGTVRSPFSPVSPVFKNPAPVMI